MFITESGTAEGVLLNCWQHGSYVEVVDALVTELRMLRAEEHRSSLKLERVHKHFLDRPFVVVVDEIDKMRPTEQNTTLYNLARLDTVSLVAVANDDHAFLELEDRVRSRLGPHVLHLP